MDALRRFTELAKEFRRAARECDLDGMDAILDERRRLLLDLRTGDGDAHARDATLRAILAFDRESEAILEEQRRALKNELVALDSGRRGLAGYGTGPTRASKWIDERR